VDYWPGINGNDDGDVPNTTFSGTGITEAAGAGLRGGNFEYHAFNAEVSNRGWALDQSYATIYNCQVGIRLARTSP